MITVTIDDPELERVYRGFKGDDKKFTEYLSLSSSANNLEYGLDAQAIEAAYDEAEVEGDSGMSLDDAFDMLKKKYDIN